MKFLRRALLLFFLVALLAVVWSFRPYPEVDRAKVYPPLLALKEPLTVKAYYFADGGTVGISITDNEQTVLQFCFPSDHRDSGYSRLFVGALHKHIQPVTEISPAEPTAGYLKQLLRARSDDPNAAHAVMCLSGRPHEYWRVLKHNFIDGKRPTISLD